MLNLFIGSSSEAKERGIIPKLVAGLNNRYGFMPRPWYEVFDQGMFILETLLKVANEIDIALLVFSKDDERESRGSKNQITRDNVVLEYGLFLAQLGRERVWVLKEEGVTLPTDLNGLNYKVFRSEPDSNGNDPVLAADLDLQIAEIRNKWKRLSSRSRTHTDLNDGGLGLTAAFSNVENWLRKFAEDLTSFAGDQSIKLSKPFYIDSSSVCLEAYAEALNLVKERFWTTTYLSSGFWTRGDARVLEANTNMLRRLREQTGDVRRLFLLSQEPSEAAQSWKRKFIHLRHQNDSEKIERFRAAFRNLKKSFDTLLREGCQVRVTYDATEYERLEGILEFDLGDSEIAIYDDFRVDVFGGGSDGIISKVNIYSNAVKYFDAIQDATEAYFDSLWQEAKPAEEYLSLLEDAYQAAERRIDYEPNWLAIYEFALTSNDENLKIVEMSRVKEVLRKLNRWGKLSRYLDIGTCTARYPIGLREALEAGSEIIGVDDDIDALRFANAQVKATADTRIQLQLLDFCAKEIPNLGKFDLITCMLGTLAHFGWERKRDFNDQLQIVLMRMADLLKSEGVLIISNWSKHAREHEDMLSIYRDWDRRRLATWSPSIVELRQRLDAAGLIILEEGQPDIRLDLFVCQRKE
ncbi:MAG: nucleotide-binding protein [Acidobacteria bacterium]|nr:nucleotide-binding protein [Acidobacteriota bacterium]